MLISVEKRQDEKRVAGLAAQPLPQNKYNWTARKPESINVNNTEHGEGKRAKRRRRSRDQTIHEIERQAHDDFHVFFYFYFFPSRGFESILILEPSSFFFFAKGNLSIGVYRSLKRREIHGIRKRISAQYFPDEVNLLLCLHNARKATELFLFY